MRFTYLLASLVFYVSLSAAWPWPANLFIRDDSGQLARRDNPPASSSAAPASTAQSNTASQTGSASGSATGSAAPSSKPTDKPNNSQSGDNNSQSGDNNSSGSSSNQPTSSVNITQVNAGGVSMIQPAATTTTYYKIGENITWVWNYTSLAVTPSAVNVLVECQSLAATYTIATNMTVNATATVTWDTGKESTANPPPDTDKYTLVIYDAGNPAGPTQTVSPGKLGAVNQFVFAMYTPQPYTALGDGYQCVTCNGALSSAERQTLGVLFTMATVTVLSFGWFANGFLSL